MSEQAANDHTIERRVKAFFGVWAHEVDFFFFGDAGEGLLEHLEFKDFDREMFFLLVKSYVPLPEGADEGLKAAFQARKEELYRDIWLQYCEYYNIGDRPSDVIRQYWDKFTKMQSEARAAVNILRPLLKSEKEKSAEEKLALAVGCTFDLEDQTSDDQLLEPNEGESVEERPTLVGDLPVDREEQTRDSQRPTSHEQLTNELAWQDYMRGVRQDDESRASLHRELSKQQRDRHVAPIRPSIPPPAMLVKKEQSSVPPAPPRLLTNPCMQAVRLPGDSQEFEIDIVVEDVEDTS